jgi:Kef-type K+ transport system membrane component KefB
MRVGARLALAVAAVLASLARASPDAGNVAAGTLAAEIADVGASSSESPPSRRPPAGRYHVTYRGYEHTLAARLEDALEKEFGGDEDGDGEEEARDEGPGDDAGRRRRGGKFEENAVKEGAVLEGVVRVGGSLEDRRENEEDAGDAGPRAPRGGSIADGAGGGADDAGGDDERAANAANAADTADASASSASVSSSSSAPPSPPPVAGSSDKSSAAEERLAMAERFLHELGATAAAVDRAVTGRDASSGSDAAEDSVARLLDRGDNEFVLANPGTGVPSLRTDARLIFDLVAVFVSGALGAFACARWSLPPTLGYVFAGVLVGPSGLDAVREPVQVSTLAHLGVLFPLFARGAELARDGKREARARSRARGNLQGTSAGTRRRAAFAGAVSAASVAAVGAALAPAAGAKPSAGAVLGAVVFFSSTDMIRWGMNEEVDERGSGGTVGGVFIGRGGGLHREGSSSVSVSSTSLYPRLGYPSAATVQTLRRRLAVQDWSLGPSFALFAAMRGVRDWRGGSWILFAATVRSVAFLLVAWFASAFTRLFTRRALKKANRADRAELRDVGLVGACLLMAALSDHFELGTELGAFAAGVLVGGGREDEDEDENDLYAAEENEAAKSFQTSGSSLAGKTRASSSRRTTRESDVRGRGAPIDAVRRLFEALQLTSAGVVFRPGYVRERFAAVALGSAFVLAVKVAAGYVAHRASGAEATSAAHAAVLGAQVGDFSLAMLTRARALGVVSRDAHGAMLSVAVVNLVSAPVVNFRWVPKLLGHGLPGRRGPAEERHTA